MAPPELKEDPPPAAEAEDELAGTRMTLGEHLEELRVRLIRSTIALVVAFVGCWIVHTTLAEVALWPQDRARTWLTEVKVGLAEEQLKEDASLQRSELFESDDPQDVRLRKPIPDIRGDSAAAGFIFYMRVCFYFGLFLAGSFILWQLWQFVAAGLYVHEKRVVHGYFPLSLVLFLGGILFGYFFMVPYGMFFLVRMSLEQVEWYPTVDDYFKFLKSLCLALGFVFQLPLVMLVLGRLELVEPKQFGRYRGHFLLLALVLAAIITPPDPVTQMMMAVPMAGLYELGILLAKVAYRRARGGSAEADAA